MYKWSSVIVTDRHSKFLLFGFCSFFWRQLCFIVNMYNTNPYQRLQGKGSSFCPCCHRLPCWGLLPSNLSPSHMKEYLKGQALRDSQNELRSIYLNVSGWLVVLFGNHASFILPEHKKFLPPAADPCQL